MKKLKFIFLVLAVLCTCSACGKKENGGNVSGDSNIEIPTYQEKSGTDEDVTIKWWLMGGSDEYYQHYWSEMKGLQAIQQATGVNIEFQVASSYDVYLPMMTAKTYPDVVTGKNLEQYRAGLAGMATDGVAVPLNDYMEEWMPNFSKIVEEYPQIGQDLRNNEGDYTFVSSLYDVNNENDRIASSKMGLAIRKDWLDEVGLDVPETIDDWFEVLTAFKKYDPNGNGIPDEEPICMASSGWKYFLPAYGIDDDPSVNENDEVIFGYITEEYKAYLEEMRKWYNEGLIYNMFTERSIEKMEERVTGNYAGAWKAKADDFDSTDDASYISKLREVSPNAEFVACPWPKTASGYQWCFSDICSFDRDTTVITDNAVANGVDKAAAYVIDFMMSEQGSTLLCWGIEGESYEVVNGEIEIPKEMKQYVDFHGKKIEQFKNYADPLTVMMPQFGQIADYVVKNMNEEYYNACKVWAQGDSSYKMMMPCQLTVEQENRSNQFSDQMKNYITKMRTRFIQGTVTLSDYDSYVQQVKKLGVEEYIDIWEDAYRAYQNR